MKLQRKQPHKALNESNLKRAGIMLRDIEPK